LVIAQAKRAALRKVKLCEAADTTEKHIIARGAWKTDSLVSPGHFCTIIWYFCEGRVAAEIKIPPVGQDHYG
jgi:hypothetical protein